VSQAEAARISAEAALAHNSALQQGEVRSAQQALQAATKDLSDCQARLADLEATNTLLIQEQQVCLLLIDLKSTWVLARQYF
jgi:hypothetical protein